MIRHIWTLLFFSLINCQWGLAQVTGNVTFLNERVSGPVLIQVQWPVEEEQNWRSSNKDRLEVMAVRTEIQSSGLPLAGEIVSSYQLEILRDRPTEVLFEIEHLEPGEVITWRNTVTNEIIFTTAGSFRSRILLPVFDPSQTIMEWTSRSSLFLSHFTIKSIYVHDSSSEREGLMIGFNTALDCMINAACKRDSLMQLISLSAVRMRMVMEEGIGWCTGSFINNTRQDKKPYILTAYHCTFEYTPQYDLWRFDLAYASDSCTTPAAEPQKFSITGCDRIAGGQASDFLLVLLNEAVPANYNVTYAGWDRDELNLPDTTYLVHHPNADIRKLSTSVNKSVVHPTTIGWSEGYTTPGEHHLKFKFTEGGHQAGSSGGPIFNQDGYLVAQHHGGSSGCEASNNAFVGRFSKSWNLGSIAAERLRDWLDPDQTGVTQLPAIQNYSSSDVASITGRVVDPQGRPVNNVALAISGGTIDTVFTNAEGNFTLQSVNRHGTYEIKPVKNDYPLNGLNAVDLFLIQKHLLGKQLFTQPWQFISADINNNSFIAASDMLILLRLLLGKIPILGYSHSWRFDPRTIELVTIPEGGVSNIEFMGIKIGDLNTSADPGL